MARRDVDLVIRARDEAQGTIRAITGALSDFVKGQKNVKQAAGDTDSALTRLSAGLKNLSAATGGLDVGAKLDRSLSKSEASVHGLVQALVQATQRASEYEAQVRSAANATEKLRQESAQVADSIRQQKAAVEQAKDAQSRLNAITRDAAKERSRLLEADQRLTVQIDQQRIKLNGLAAEFDSLAVEIAATEKPTAAMGRRLESLDRRGYEAEAAFRKLAETQAVVRAAIDQTARSVGRANSLYGQQASSLDRQVAALDRMQAAQKKVAGALDAAVSNQSKLETEAQRAATALTKQVAALDRTEASHEELQAAIAGTRMEMGRVEAAVRGPMLKAFAEQRKIVAELGAKYKTSRAEATRLGAAIAKLGDQASDQLVADFTAAAEASNRIEAAWREQAQAANAFRAILRETGGDLSDLTARQNRFEQTLTGASGAYRSFAAASKQASQGQAQAAAQAAAATQRLTGATRAQGAAARQAARETGTFAAAIRQFYGDSRTALSFTQRLRSEVLSLIAAYAGIFAVVEGVRRVVDAFQTLEAAQSRLGTVFEGDQTKVASELDFIRRNAERLGIEFGILSQEYSKFAVATKGTNLEGEETRRIFIKVAEAARVMRLSNENVQGVMVALGQIVSKGAVQMEELRQQLGDRLPGALQIMAAGLGVSSGKLIEMLENGEVTADALSKFADELDRRFGSQVPDALKTTSAAIGRFQNAVFQAFLRIAQGGFIERFTEMLDDLTATLDSADFASFANKVSTALGAMADFLALAARNWQTLVIVASAFVSLKLSGFVVAAVKSIGDMAKVSGRAGQALNLLRISLDTGHAAAFRLAAGMRAARVAVIGLLSSTGIGVLAVLIGTAIGAWVTSTDDATEALVEHQRILDDVRNAYDKVGGSAEKWTKEIEKFTTVTEVRANLKAQNKLYEEQVRLFDDLIAKRRLFDKVAPMNVDFGRLDAITTEFKTSRNAEDFRRQIDEFFEELRDAADSPQTLAFVENLADEFIKLGKALGEAGVRGVQAEQMLAALEKTGGDVEAALKLLNNVVEEGTEGFVDYAAQAEQFESALAELQKLAPDLAADLKEMTEAASLEAAYQSALKYAKTLEDVERAEVAYQAALKERDTKAALAPLEGVSGDARSKAAALLRREENPDGPWLKAQWDTNHFRIGYSSDTIRGGQKVEKGMTATVAEAEAELVRRIDLAFQQISKSIGEVRLKSFSDEQQAVLVSLVYNYGSLANTGILDVIRTGAEEDIAKAIEGLSANPERRKREGLIFRSGQISDEPSFEAFDKERDAAEKERQRAEEERQKQREAALEHFASNEAEIRQQQLANAGLERAAFIEAEINAFKAKGNQYTEAELVLVGQQAAQKYDLLNASKEQEAAEQRVNDILELRTALQEQLAIALERGDFGAVGKLDETLRGVNVQLVEAIDNALKLLAPLAAMDPAIAAAVTRLETLKLTAQDTSSEIVISFEQVRDVFASGLTNAIDKFVAGMHEGKSATESARDAFMQFAADFLREIAKMIIQQLIKNAITSMMTGGAAHLGGVIGQQSNRRQVAIMHEGGVAGQAAPRRALDPVHFWNAMRYHGGGVPGLRTGEIPTVLQRGEEVLTQDDPRHIFNFRKSEGKGGGGQGVRVVNAFDGTSFLEEALKTREGEKIILNFLKARGGAVRSAIGG